MEAGMTLDEAARQFRIPVKALRAMQEQGLISYPLKESDLNNLSFLSHLWGREKYLRLQLASRSMARRQQIIRAADLNKIEQYVLNRYLNLQPGQKLHYKLVADEIESYYKAPRIVALNAIRKIRKRVYNQRQRGKKGTFRP